MLDEGSTCYLQTSQSEETRLEAAITLAANNNDQMKQDHGHPGHEEGVKIV